MQACMLAGKTKHDTFLSYIYVMCLSKAFTSSRRFNSLKNPIRQVIGIYYYTHWPDEAQKNSATRGGSHSSLVISGICDWLTIWIWTSHPFLSFFIHRIIPVFSTKGKKFYGACLWNILTKRRTDVILSSVSYECRREIIWQSPLNCLLFNILSPLEADQYAKLGYYATIDLRSQILTSELISPLD